MSDKKYVGSGKKAGKYDIVNINICLSDVSSEDIYTSEKTGKKYLRLSVGSRQSEDQYGNTHTVWVDNFKPEPQQQSQAQPAKDEGLPF